MWIETVRDEHTGEKRIVVRGEADIERHQLDAALREAREYLQKATEENPEDTAIGISFCSRSNESGDSTSGVDLVFTDSPEKIELVFA